jgi:hypothetical protein
MVNVLGLARSPTGLIGMRSSLSMEAGPDGRRAVHHTDEYVLPCEQVRQLPICHAAINMITKAYMRKIILRIT